ncbi:periplasmic binding protein [Leptolyngbya sp. Heron Island J]|nr:periplasmic binding protein [Leptolyngbya sp. Heron Island J]
MRPIQHATGTAQVPVSPQRVVVLDYAPLDTALALDVIPVGMTEVPISPIYPEVINDITVVGKGLQPNLETILKLKPDLILGSKVGANRWYRQLSDIAPTVLTKDNGREGSWQENFRLHADALGQAEQAKQILAAYQQRVDTLQIELQQPLQTMTVSVIANWSRGVIAYSADSFPGSILQDLGFERNPYQGQGKRYGVLLSKEELSAIDGDILFLMHQSTDDNSIAKTEFISDPLWSTLNVVKQGIVCEVDSTTWAGGRSILAANQILTDVELCLSQEK